MYRLLTFSRSLGGLSTLGRSLSVGLSGLGLLSLLSRLLGLVLGGLLLRLVLLAQESTEKAGALAGLGAALCGLLLGLLGLLSLLGVLGVLVLLGLLSGGSGGTGSTGSTGSASSTGGSTTSSSLLLGLLLLGLFLVLSGLLGSFSRLVCWSIVSYLFSRRHRLIDRIERDGVKNILSFSSSAL